MMGKSKLERLERLRDVCERIVDDPHNVDDGTRAALKTATLEYVNTFNDPMKVLKRLYYGGELGDYLMRKAVEIVTEADGGDAEISKAVRNRGSGHRNFAAALIAHLHDALERRRRLHGYEKAHTAKESTMNASLEGILKDYGAVKICKHICAEGKTGYSEFELTSALTKCASEMYPGLTSAQAFAKLYESDASIWQACNIAKATPFSVAPVVVTGDAARDVDSAEAAMEAYNELLAKAAEYRRRNPALSEAQAFSAIFEAKENAALAAKAHRRPSATTFYEYPR